MKDSKNHQTVQGGDGGIHVDHGGRFINKPKTVNKNKTVISISIAIGVVAIVVVGIIIWVSIGGNKLVGAWGYGEQPYIEFFSDGTYQEQGKYGTGTYHISGDQLKMTDFYGETMVVKFSIKNNELVITSLDHNNETVLHHLE